MEEEFGRIIDPSEVEAGAFRGGRWNYEGLAEALRTLFPKPKEGEVKGAEAVSYTHLTLPTICSV